MDKYKVVRILQNHSVEVINENGTVNALCDCRNSKGEDISYYTPISEDGRIEGLNVYQWLGY